MSDIEKLPDPRNRKPLTGPLRDAARNGAAEPLAAALRQALAAADDAQIRFALQGAEPALARRIWRAMATVIDDSDGSVGLRLFAIPVVIVAGSRAPATLPGTVPEIAGIVELLEKHGAVGVTRNFGLGNALCSAAALEALSPSMLWRATRNPAERAVAEVLPPEPIVVTPGREQVHLRFLVGAGIAPQHLPSFLESAANIGTWGMPLTRELARQLAQPGVEILPLPRPPQSLARAAWVGRCAQLEAALSLFLGNTVRHFRMSVGDPQAVYSAHHMEGGAGELRLSLSSPFDDALLEGFCWPLHPLDEIGEVAQVFDRALADCQVRDISVVDHALPAVLDRGMTFVAARFAGDHARAQVRNS